MKSVLIFGAGQVAQTMAEQLLEHGVKVRAFVVDRTWGPPSAEVAGIPLAAFEEVEKFSPAAYAFVIGMSFKGLNKPRALKFAAMKEKGYEPYTFVDRSVRLGRSALIGEGSFVMGWNEIQASVTIGQNCVLWSGNHLGHNTRIGNHVFIASHVVISGACSVGDYSFLGVNASVGDGLKIGESCLIGQGAIIAQDCEPNGCYPGVRSERSGVPASRMARLM